MNTQFEKYERVPEATQLLVIPFLAAVSGLLASREPDADYRVTLHRTMCRDKQIYLQQVVNYFSSDAGKVRGSGRIFAVDTGIIGAAFKSCRLHRTSKFSSDEELVEALKDDLKRTNDPRNVDEVPYSYFALPFRVAQDSVESNEGQEAFPAMILYADCFRHNIFSDDGLTKDLCAMSARYAAALDLLAHSPLERVRNFPFSIDESEVVLAGDEPFPRLNGRPEAGSEVELPLLKVLKSLNFDFVA